MFQLFFVFLIVVFVIGVYVHDRNESSGGKDEDAMYEKWKSENHIKDL